MTNLTNPAVRLEFWLKQAEDYARRVREEVKRNSRNRVAPSKIIDVWALIWGLDPEDTAERTECYRRAMAMIEAAQQVRRTVQSSRNGLAPLALKHFEEVERALEGFMSMPSGQIIHMMDHIQGTGWHSLELTASIINSEAPDPTVDPERVAAHLTEVRDLIDEVAKDSNLAIDLRTYILRRLREVEDALIEATVNGAPALEMATNAMFGASRRQPDVWDRIADTKWAPRIAAVWMAMMTTLGAAGGAPALMPGGDEQPQQLEQNVVIVNDAVIVDGEIVDESDSGPSS